MNESYTKTIENKRKLICKNNIISVLIFLWFLGIPANVQAATQKTKYDIKHIIELNDTANLLDKMNQKFWINLPAQYNENLKNFISNSTTLHNEAASQFTENFISEQMSQNRWISKENQYLFIWCTIYSTLTNWELYDWTDWNTQRYNEYEMAFDYFLNCEENYKTKLKELMENEQQRARDDAQRARDDAQTARNDAQRARNDAQRARDDAQTARNDAQTARNDAQTARNDAQRARDDAIRAKEDLQRSRENLQRSRENLQRSRENLQRSREDAMRTDTIWLQELTNYYLKYKQNPSLAMPEEVNHVKSIAEDIIQSCKKYWIDYKQLLSPEIRRFYWIE